MNDIGKFKIERMIFNDNVKESLNKMVKHSGIKVEYYDEYHEDDDVFYVDGEKHTLLTVKKYIRNYFININKK